MTAKAIVTAYAMMALGVLENLNTATENCKKEILAEWDRSKNYPRKKKKHVRKELQLRWNIANWNPFEN